MEPLVTVVCTTYNHEPYIRKCLDGFVMQQTDFPFEILVHDDASTDNTAAIVREYEEKYPHLFRTILQTENQHSKKIRVLTGLLPSFVKSKFVASCEGDDYWTDPLKLQKQIDALRENPDCRVCVHGVQCVTENDRPLNQTYPRIQLESGKIKSEEFIQLVLEYQFQTSSYCFYTEEYQSLGNQSFYKESATGDVPMLLHFLSCGNAYFLKDTMSCYRQNSVGSWSQRYAALSADQKALKKECTLSMLKKYDEETEFKYHAICYRFQLQQRFDIDVLMKNYTSLFRQEYRPIRRSLPVKSLVFYFLNAYLPCFVSGYRKLKRKGNAPHADQ